MVPYSSPCTHKSSNNCSLFSDASRILLNDTHQILVYKSLRSHKVYQSQHFKIGINTSLSSFSALALLYSIMALRSPTHVKSMISRLRGTSNLTTSTTPRMKPVSLTLDLSPEFKARAKKGDLVPVCMAVGMIAMSSSFGIYTGMKELRHAPDVHVKKSRRETIPELVEPEHVVEESEKFIKKSLFRRLAHIQDPNAGSFSRQPKTETLKDIGVDPKLI